MDKSLREYTAVVVRDIRAGKQIDVQGAEVVLDKGKTAFGEAVKISVMSNPRLTLIKQEAEAFKQAFECSPTGIWIDENQTTVIVVGVLGVIGGVAYMYKYRSGDALASLSKDLLQKTWKVGSVDLGTKVTKFKPSKREFGLEVSANTKWRQFKADFAMNFLVEEKKFTFSTASSVTVALSTDKTLSLGMTQKTDNSGVLPSQNNAGLNTDVKAFVNMAYTKDQTTMKFGASFATDEKPSYFLSLIVQF